MKNFLSHLLGLALASGSLVAQTPLLVPPLLTGDSFNLQLVTGTVDFFPGYSTPTYGVNGPILGPTLEMVKGHEISIRVQNDLPVSTTVHWHGLHVPAVDDGGPHQSIPAGGVWEPSFTMLNDAGTFWYHPHGEHKTELHVAKGIAGFILVRDPVEAALALPRTYGVDDFPLAIQTKAFDVLRQVAIASEDDTLHMVNATVDPYLDAPAQVVRLRLLNGASMRTFHIGMSDNSAFHVIATDGGLLDSAVSVTRLRISPGERYEILVNLVGREGDTLHLMSYASELPNGIYGAETVGMGMATIPDYDLNPLNGSDFGLLELRVVAPTAGSITSVPAALAPFTPWATSSADTTRTLLFTADMIDPSSMVMGPFLMNGTQFHMDSVNVRTWLGSTEVWTLTNNTMIAHPFHIHDIQFYVVDENGAPPPAIRSGRKDVVVVMPMQSVSFITRFEDFADKDTPYMYHCHLLHHEDEGMMGSFLVLDTAAVGVQDAQASSPLRIFPNPADGQLGIQLPAGTVGAAQVQVMDMLGREVLAQQFPAVSSTVKLDVAALHAGSYQVRCQVGAQSWAAKVLVLH